MFWFCHLTVVVVAAVVVVAVVVVVVVVAQRLLKAKFELQSTSWFIAATDV
jgi:ABC-type uncharacterized transport system fused permease/ATPase subunit